MPTKSCRICQESKPLSAYSVRAESRDGYRHDCIACASAAKRRIESAARDREYAASVERIASEYTALKPEDFDVTIGNVGGRDAKASSEKRQEYSKAMGANASALDAAARAAASSGDGDILGRMPATSGAYIGSLLEQERRFGNRRIARSVSLAQAHEALAIAQFKSAAQEYLHDKITPAGYAAKRLATVRKKRSAVLLLSDLHLGSDLSSLDEPLPFRAVEEARRLEFVIRQLLDYKPQHRNDTEAVLLLNGDMIEGQLGHDLRGGAPLTEQKVIFWRYFRQAIAAVAAAFPSVRVICQPGNHGRDKVRHPGRATSRKWDGHEWELYFGLREMASGLHNVTWSIDFRAVSVVDLHGTTCALTHGDTEIKLGHPDTKATANRAHVDRLNAARTWGVEFAAVFVGHYHTPRYHPGTPAMLYNGALVPPNGYARSEGYVSERCGQWLFEAVEGFPIGDLRFIEVGPAQDRDENLGKLITPFRFEI